MDDKKVLKDFVTELRRCLKLGSPHDSTELHEVLCYDETIPSLYDNCFGSGKRGTPTMITRCLMSVKDDMIFKSSFIFEKRKNKMFLVPRVNIIETDDLIKGIFEITSPGSGKETIEFIGIGIEDAEKMIKYVTRISNRGL
jgi:hypothetical protein